jgi:hypothetical protein
MLIKPNAANSDDPLDRFSKEFFQKTPFAQQSFENFIAQFELLDDFSNEEIKDKETEHTVVEDEIDEIDDVILLDDGEIFGSGTNMKMIEYNNIPNVHVDNFIDEENSDDENDSSYTPSAYKPSNNDMIKSEQSASQETVIQKFNDKED